MRKKFLNEKGFTLIEMIASIVILVIVGALVIISTVKIVQVFAFTKMNAETAQKGHIALNRLTKEFTNIISVGTDTTTTLINFTSPHYITGPPATNRRVRLAGDELLIGDGVNEDILVDNVKNVDGFVLTYYDEYDDGGEDTWGTSTREIEITLKLVGANGNVSTFTTRVVPRNLEEN